MKHPSLIALCVALASADLHAQTNVWQPSAGHQQVLIWPGAAPDARRQVVKGPESVRTAGKPPTVEFVNNVTQPTLTVYPPKGTNTGVAVVVFPGGGYNELAMDLEGTEICDWLNSQGITGVLLKYRVPSRGTDDYAESPLALEDAQRTLSLVRFHAAEWQINPNKIGVIGFSAGGHLVTATSTHYAKRSYRAVDAADKESCRPDFAMALYPGHLWSGGPLVLNPNVPVTTNTPPTFMVLNENDPVDSINNSLVYYMALKQAGVLTEMHLYAQGGHGFGLRRTKYPVCDWPLLAERWWRTIGVISQ